MRNTLAVVATFTATFWLTAAAAQPPAGDKPAAAAAAPPMGAPPKPAPENDMIKKSSGTWRCEGTMKGPDGQEMKFKSSWSIKPTLGGHWHEVVYKRAKSGPMPAFEGHATVGYNLAEKRYSFVGFDNMGGWIDLNSTDGAAFTGNSGDMGKTGPVKFNFSPGKDKKGEESDKMFDLVMDFGTATSNESCKK